MDQLSLFGTSNGTLRVETTNSKDYLPHWDMVNAVKELLQNAVYAKTVLGARIKLEYDGRLAHISDNAQGFTMDKLMIGKSEQRDSEISPGFFGEGMKLSLLVAARQNKECRFDTVGFSVKGAIEQGVLGPDTFVMYITPTKRKSGTEFVIECTAEEFSEARKSFALLNGVPQKQVMTETLLPDMSNKVYVAGVLVSEPKSLWGYNLMNKALINRDRSTVDHDLLLGRVREVLMTITKPLLAEQLLHAVADDQGKEYLEVTACLPNYKPSFTDKQKKMWKVAARKVFGSKLCLASGDEYDTAARYRNFTPIIGLNYEWRDFFNWVLDIPYSSGIGKVAHKPKLKAVTLMPEEKKLFRQYKRVIGEFYGDCGKVKVAKELIDPYDNPCSGLYDDSNEGTIWLSQKVFEQEEELFTTLLHETNHRQSRAKDNTVEFTEAWELICWKLYNSKQRRRVVKPEKLTQGLAAK